MWKQGCYSFIIIQIATGLGRHLPERNRMSFGLQSAVFLRRMSFFLGCISSVQGIDSACFSPQLCICTQGGTEITL